MYSSCIGEIDKLAISMEALPFSSIVFYGEDGKHNDVRESR